MRPRIGLTSWFVADPASNPLRERLYLNAAYFDAVYAAGGTPLPLPVPPQTDPAVCDALLAAIDGLIFTGGSDIDPRNYDEPRHPKTDVMHPRRSAFEVELFRRADAARVPIFAICLGFQVAHVARGGKLVQHVADLERTPTVMHSQPGGSAFHTVRITPGSHLAEIVGATEIEVNSRHHQGVGADRHGRGLQPVAYAPDGLLEGAEDCSGRFLLAVQWHPEDLFDRPEHLRLFEALVQAARR
jgi:gamma-glutamyl-gamma-aminobutyrate hydrolase PuuD